MSIEEIKLKASLIEALKRRIEARFKISYLKHKNPGSQLLPSLASELNSAEMLISTLKKKDISIENMILPRRDEFLDADRIIEKEEQSKVVSAFIKKEGELYSLLKTRGGIIKNWNKYKFELAHIDTLMRDKPEDIVSQYLSGNIDEHFTELLTGNLRRAVERILPNPRRERRIVLGDVPVWVNEDEYDEVERFSRDYIETEKKIKKINATLGLTSTENEYYQIQKKYAELLREKEKWVEKTFR